MDPDGIIKDPGKKNLEKRHAVRDSRRARRKVLWRLRDVFRGVFGFRRVPRAGKFQYLTEEERRALPGDEPGQPQPARPYVVRTLAFAAVALLAVLAYGAFVRGVKLDERPESAQLFGESMAALNANDTAKARELRDRVAALGHDDPVLDFITGNLVAVEGGQAARDLEAQSLSVGRSRASIKELLTIAGFRSGKRDGKGCVEVLQQAAKKRPRDAAIRLLLANALMAARSYEQAIKEATAYEGLDGQPGAAARLRARAYMALNQPAEARREYEAALAYPDASPDLRMELSRALTSLGEYDSAVLLLQRAKEDGADPGRVSFAQGTALELAGRLDEAEKAYLEALKAHPDDVVAMNNLAYLIGERKGNPKAALPWAEKAYKIAPDLPAVMDTLGRCYQLTGRTGDAVGLLRKAAEKAPADAEIQLHLGEALVTTGATAEARSVLKKLAARTENDDVRDRAREQLARLGPS